MKYIRKVTLSADDMLIIIKNARNNEDPRIDGESFDPFDTRYDLYLEKGLTCTKCGIYANIGIFEKQRAPGPKEFTQWHINFYARKDGVDRMITRDHILPKSLGGPDTVENCQPMCEKCNQRKGNGVNYKAPAPKQVQRIMGEILDRDEIGDMVEKVLSTHAFEEMRNVVDQTTINNLSKTIASNLHNYIVQGHDDLPASKKWAKMKKSKDIAQAHIKTLIQKLQELSAAKQELEAKLGLKNQPKVKITLEDLFR